MARYSLPSNLREVSGLAAVGDSLLLAHDDEYAIIHEIDSADGRITRSFALGNPTIEGDFEGIASDRSGQLYLVTSDGLIYAFPMGEHRQRVPYRAHDSGIGPRCEIEGLSRAPEPGFLLLLCKRLRNGDSTARLEIYRWRLGTEHADSEPWLAVALDTFLDQQQRAEFAPSGIEWDEERGRLLIVSGRSHLLVELDADGNVMESRPLDRGLHRQAEGIAILPGCRLALADEGGETAKARLAVYPCP
ncbi:SdiA-regulated domain-containing protein [Altererythrobacter sp. MF3-039]|uniref:SdiA-regulated domain-containing protein n=1 Tax=Altererythrobacter sp. MF3-039 TaxID=3252901 RepID=UPI00390C8BD3